MYAVKTIQEVHAAGGKLKSFVSMVCGLPAPEDSDNPLGYKFSWSARGVLLALKNPAKIWQGGDIVDIASEDLMDAAKPYFVYPGYALVGYPNRDSTPYKQRYNIPEAETIIRGSMRYQGFPQFVKVLVQTGFLEEKPHDAFKNPQPWKEATKALLGASSSSQADLEAAIIAKATFDSPEERSRIISGLRWIGIFSDEKTKPRGTALDTLCAELEEKMKYEEGERDMVILQHRFGIEHKDGTQETRTATLIDYGDPKGYTSMGKLVGIVSAGNLF